jgi:hypothetical protein
LIERLGALEESIRSGKPLAQTKSNTASSATSRADVSRSSSVTSSTAGAAVKQALETEPRAFAASIAPVQTLSASTEPEALVDDSEIGRIKSALEKRRKMFLVTLLEGAVQAAIVDDELCVEFAPEAKSMRDTLAKADNVKVLREICKEVTGSEVGVRFVINDPKAAPDPAVSKQDTERREKQSLRETAEKDPVVQQMLRTFRGEIVDVRRVDRE